MIVGAIDPGTTHSAYVVWDSEERVIRDKGYVDNVELRYEMHCFFREVDALSIEMVACYGMPVGREVFETVLFIGRLVQCWEEGGNESQLVYRRDIKLHHCGSARAKDGNIRQVLIDKYGAPGTKKAPGLTYGISKHLWSAFAIATYVTETNGLLKGRKAEEGKEGREAHQSLLAPKQS